jgi:hypothetical protein
MAPKVIRNNGHDGAPKTSSGEGLPRCNLSASGPATDRGGKRTRNRHGISCRRSSYKSAHARTLWRQRPCGQLVVERGLRLVHDLVAKRIRSSSRVRPYLLKKPSSQPKTFSQFSAFPYAASDLPMKPSSRTVTSVPWGDGSKR